MQVSEGSSLNSCRMECMKKTSCNSYSFEYQGAMTVREGLTAGSNASQPFT